MTRVVNLRQEKYDVYIGRAGKPSACHGDVIKEYLDNLSDE